MLILTTPNFTNAVTTNVQILNQDNVVLYQTPEQARNTTVVYKIDVAIAEQETFKATTSGAHGDDPAKSVTIDMAYIPDYAS